MEKILSVKCR